MTDNPTVHPESAGAASASAPSPFDQPTESFAVRPGTARPLAQTDEDLDFGAPGLGTLPTEQIPTVRSAPVPTVRSAPVPAVRSAPVPARALEDQPTTVIERRDPVEPVQVFADPILSEAIVSEPIVSEPIVSEPIAAAAVGPVAIAPASAPDEDVPDRGTLDVGVLVLRLALGGTLVMHGLQKLTGWWNGPGVAGYRDELVDAGFDHARVLAVVGAVGEVAGGVMLILGLLTPLAAAGVLVVMVNAWCLKQSAAPGLAYFAPGGVEYETLIGAVAAALILTGPGRIALDGRRRWATRPHVGSAVILVVALAVGLGAWFLLNGANPVI